MNFVEVDYVDITKFVQALNMGAQRALTAERDTMKLIADNFLNAVVESILEKGSFDTGRLADSFYQGNADNVYILSDGGLDIEVGTNVDYADWVNTGHHQEPGRFIPGFWTGDQFTYDPGADTGMVLKASWVEGSHYYDEALSAYRSSYPAEAKRYFDALIKDIFNV